MDNLVDIGLNLMHSSFKKDRVEIIEDKINSIQNAVEKLISYVEQ